MAVQNGLIQIIADAAAASGCSDLDACRAVLEEAHGKRAPLIEALLDAGIVDEQPFFERLAASLGMEFCGESELDLTVPLHTRFPAKLLKGLYRRQDDPEAVRQFGVLWATEQCRDLLDNDVRGIHFYTLNRSDATKQIYETLGAKDSAALR